MEGLNLDNNLLTMNVPLDNFATSTMDQIQHSSVLAVCTVEETTKGPKCYIYSTCKCSERKWRAEASGAPDTAFNDCATMLTGLGGSRACEQRRQSGSSISLIVAPTSTWCGFVSEGCLFLKGDGWDDMSIRESVVAALDLAEEQLGCHTVYLCLEKTNPILASLVRTLMYVGFEMVHPSVLANADPKYLVLGMEL
ncbi:hypothetical protein BGZ94_007597 [Podila epigama]|nr:hypothetical protein BGZ94_007597 [Podila epigama]